MSNNIPNMNAVGPIGYNPQGAKQSPQGQAENTEPAQVENTQNNDPLKFVPGDQYGRAMVNQAQGVQKAPSVNPQNIQDDIFTFQLMQEFTQDLIQGYIQKGVTPEEAQRMALITTDVLLNPTPTNTAQV